MSYLQPSGNPYNPEDIISCNNRLFFTASHTSTGRELFENDGTIAEPTMIADIQPGVTDSNISKLTCMKNKLFFSANDGTNGTELWVLTMPDFPWILYMPAFMAGRP